MIFSETPISGAYLIEMEPRSDARGFFARAFCEKELLARGLTFRVAQVNDSFSDRRATLRGLHYQLAPHAEVKLVRCIRGAIFDVIVDLRQEEKTYLQHFAAELSSDNRKMLLVPEGCAHGFITLQDSTEVLYLVDEPYSPGSERGLRWDDPALAIAWPFDPEVISERDQSHPTFTPSWHLVPP